MLAFFFNPQSVVFLVFQTESTLWGDFTYKTYTNNYF